jgi:hypothetical protein
MSALNGNDWSVDDRRMSRRYYLVRRIKNGELVVDKEWWGSCMTSAIIGEGAHGKGKWDIV